jgi:hypothetical protein
MRFPLSFDLTARSRPKFIVNECPNRSSKPGVAACETPRRVFSQTALLADDGEIRVGDRGFFVDYDRDASPK